MNLLQRFKKNILAENLFYEKDRLLLAVSGGIDSVVLSELCKQAGFDFAMAHCNFQLREADSERDEKFVRELAGKYSVPFHVIKFDTKTFSKERKISTQEAARELRYNWFEEIRKAGSYRYILTAHHADDNIETVLMNFFRGTGIKGIRGIESKHGFIVRPLLFARRKDLEEFLEENNLVYVSDFTNEQNDYTRNYFRNKVIPFIEKSFPEVNDNLLANITRFRETVLLYQQAIELHKKKLLEFKGKEVHIPVLKLKKTDPLHSIIYEIINDYGFSSSQVDEVIALLDSESGKYVQSSSHRIIKNRGWLIIALNESTESEIIVIDAVGNWQFAMGNLQIEMSAASSFKPLPSNFVASLDAGEIKFPLLLRKWKQGDYFYPLGMKKKKKLARFFIDQKLSKTDKEKVWVIEMNKKIVWVVGHRIDDRFKITDKTKTILKITFDYLPN
ncbi:MAG: tRNA lysidine(34) synthetase TilS [Chitinophagaceae bacterium]